MKTNQKSKNRKSYQVRTNQKAGMACFGQMSKVDDMMANCADDSAECQGISHAILCMVADCKYEPIPCLS